MKTSKTRLRRRASLDRVIEPLECRIAPASTVSVSGGNLSVIDAVSGNDNITFSATPSTFHFFDPNGIIAGNGAVQDDAFNVDVDLATVTGPVTIDTSTGNDFVRLNAGLPPLAGLTVKTQTLAPLPALSIDNGLLDLTATASDITIASLVTAGSVTLHSGGLITTLASGLLTADSIDAHANTGIALKVSATTLSAVSIGSGGITLDTPGSLGLGSLDPGTGAVTLNSGTFTLPSNNTFVGSPNMTVNGTLDVAGFSATIGALGGNGAVGNSAAVGSTLSIGANNGSDSFSGSINGNLLVIKLGSGTETFSGTQSYSALVTNAGTMNLFSSLPNATISNNGGVLFLAGDNAGSIVNVNAATHFKGSQSLGALNINGMATLDAHGMGGSAFVIDTQALTIAVGAQLDLTNNAMVVRGGDLAAITAQLSSGQATSTGGYWNGNGINSSTAAADAQQITALGVVNNDDLGYGSFAGIPLSPFAHDVLVRFTYYGDADLNGQVDGVDYALADVGQGNPGLTGWVNGDFNYDGAIDATDFSQLDNAYAQQAGGPGTVIHQWNGSVSNDWFDPANWTNGVPDATDTAVLGKFGGLQPQLNTTANVAFFDMANGTLTGAGTLSIGQGMTWLGGAEAGVSTIFAGAAKLTLGGGNGKQLDGASFTLPGSTNVLGNGVGSLFLDNGATLKAGASQTPHLILSLQAGGGVIDTNGFDVTLDEGSSINGPGGLTKIGTGTLLLGSFNSYGGTTQILAGVVTVDAPNELAPGSAVTVNGGTLDIGAFNQATGSVLLTNGNITGTTGKLNAAGLIQINGGTVSADLGSAVAIDISAGTINANLDAGASGTITLDGGAWTVKSSNATGSALTVNGGLLKLGSFTETVGALAVTGGTIASTNGTIHSFLDANLNNAAITANIVADAGITLNSGTVNGNLDGADNTITINGGTVTYSSTITTQSALVINGGNLALGATSPVFGSLTLSTGTITATTGTLVTSHDLDIDGGTVTANVDAGANNITLNGGTLTLNTNLNIASTLVVNGGTFVLGTKTAVFGGLTLDSGAITGTGTIISATDFNVASGTLGVKLAGNVGLVKSGPGTVVLANSKNSYTGIVIIADGSLQIASNGALGNLNNDLDIEGTGTLVTTASITSARHISVNGANPTINVTSGTVTLNGVIDGTGMLHKIGPGNLLFGSNFIGTTTSTANSGPITIGGTKVIFKGTGTITLTVVDDGMGGTRISTVELADTDATTVLAINGPRAPLMTTIDTIESLDPNDEIGTIKVGKTVLLGNGVDDAIPDINIVGKVNKLLLNDINSYFRFELGKGLPYNNIGDDTTPDSYNNHPDLKLRNVLGTGVVIDVTNNGIAGDQPGSIGGGGLGKVVINSWTQPGLVETTQSIGSFLFKHGDCNVVFLVDPDHLGALTTAGVGKMLVPNGAWGSSGSIVEGNVTVFSAGQFLAAANITAGSMTKLLVKKGPYLGTTTLKNPDAAALGTFSVNGNYEGYVDSAQPLKNINIKGIFKGSIKASVIGSLKAYSFNGTVGTNDDPVGDPARHNIYVTEGSLGTIKASAGGIQNFEIAVATVFNGFNISWPTAPGGAIGIDNVTVAAGQINNITVNLGAPNALSTGINNSIFESAGSIGNITSSHTVTGSTFAAPTTMGNVVVKGDLLGSKLLAGTSLGGDGIFDGNEAYTRAGKIGNVTVLGMFATTSIAVGVDPGADFTYGNGDDVAAPGVATPKALGALVFGAASGSVFGPAGMIHTDAIEAATIKSLKVGTNPVLKTFITSHYIQTGGSEAGSDVLVRIL